MILCQTSGSPARLAAFVVPGLLVCASCTSGAQSADTRTPTPRSGPLTVPAFKPSHRIVACRLPTAIPQG